MSIDMDDDLKLLKLKEFKRHSRKWILTCHPSPSREVIDIPSMDVEFIANSIAQFVTNLYILANVNDKMIHSIYDELIEIFEKIKEISEVNRISNISQYEFKHYLLILEYHWATICEYYIFKHWFQATACSVNQADYELRSLVLNQEYNLSHISVELIDCHNYLRHICHYYASCNYWRMLDKNIRFQVIETAKNMFVKLEAQSINIQHVLLNIHDEIILETHRLKSKLQLYRIAKLSIVLLLLGLLLLFHLFTIYLNDAYQFHFPDIGTSLTCLLAHTDVIAATKGCWDRQRLDLNQQITSIVILWLIMSPITYGIYVYLTSFFELHTLALLEDYYNIKQKINHLRDEYDQLRRFTILSL